jgi:Predicted nucleotide-utilizing enzyme related to molybdopterin-biosynthesis enzyme MoeA
MKKIKNPTACIIIIGNEILSGRTLDTNKNYICKELTMIGIDVIEARVIKDDIKKIISVINEVRKKYDYIFTTGGIGPTHDDVTAISIAKAFKVKLKKNKKALNILKKYYKTKKIPINDAKEKMALIPHGAELLHNPITKAAGFRMKNVYVMAGIPEIMIAMFKRIIRNIKVGNPKITKNISINLPESDIAEHLSKIQKEFDEIEIGSYPLFKNKKKKVNLVLTGFHKIDINQAEKKIKQFIKFIK